MDEVFVIPRIFCGFIVIELASFRLIIPFIGKFVMEKMPPIDPSMCSQIFLSLQILPMLSIGSIAPRTVVPRVATIANILLPSLEPVSYTHLTLPTKRIV